jgi:hypothetical protein
MPEAAGGLSPRVSTKASVNPGVPNAVRLGLRADITAPDARALRHVLEAADRFTLRGPAREVLES